MSLNRAPDPGPRPTVAESAVVVGELWLGAGAYLAQGLVVRSHEGGVRIGNHSAVLENSTVWGSRDRPTEIGQRTVFGHRATVLGATVGNLCEIGNGTILMPGSRLGDGCILGEGTLVPAGMVVPPDTVLVGRPPHVLRSATDVDRERLAVLREHQVQLTDHPHQLVTATPDVGADMGRLYSYGDKNPVIDPTAVLFDSAEITGDVTVGPETVIGAGVKIIGDSHGPVRVGARVQILANTVLHLLPDNELVVEDDCVIGPGSMIHGCHIGAGTVVEAGAIVCDWSTVGPGSLVRAGSCVTQRSRFPAGAVLSGFPATETGHLDAPPDRPAWAFTADGLATIVRLR
ncbi:MAG TPA: DapH/DapD/GlmU-related protein [Pseudonocardiaceae bacterium]|nr:DapH/DapD/GlmU-related protein [Pseudonocardiaceae bacterium]